MTSQPLSSAEQSIATLLNNCTVKVQTDSDQGTGFFVAPGLIVTCHHVVRDNRVVTVTREETSTIAPVMDIVRGRNWDLALLEFVSTGHPCVLLNGGTWLGDKVYTFGYTDEYPNGDPASFEFEGLSPTPPLLKLKDGQARPGLSGAPVLNLRTGGVCGVIKRSREINIDLGARAIPVEPTLTWVFEGLGIEKAQRAYHRVHTDWVDIIRSPNFERSNKPTNLSELIRHIELIDNIDRTFIAKQQSEPLDIHTSMLGLVVASIFRDFPAEQLTRESLSTGGSIPIIYQAADRLIDGFQAICDEIINVQIEAPVRGILRKSAYELDSANRRLTRFRE